MAEKTEFSVFGITLTPNGYIGIDKSKYFDTLSEGDEWIKKMKDKGLISIALSNSFYYSPKTKIDDEISVQAYGTYPFSKGCSLVLTYEGVSYGIKVPAISTSIASKINEIKTEGVKNALFRIIKEDLAKLKRKEIQDEYTKERINHLESKLFSIEF